jgi:glycosyltransferase involved in cell wall biosynthesis
VKSLLLTIAPASRTACSSDYRHPRAADSTMTRDLIVFGEDWGGLPSSTQHIVGRLARDRRVLWVNSIGLRQPQPGLDDLRRLGRKLGRAAALPTAPAAIPAGPGFSLLNPLAIPAPRGSAARMLSTVLLQRQVTRAASKAGLSKPVLWISLPTAVDLVGRLGESAVVYYCGDDFSALAGVDHATVAAREAELACRADLILAASDRLQQRFPVDKTRVIHHGVDFDLFAHPVERAADLPDDGRPIAGFYGSIADWLDTALLTRLARRLPHWHFVLIGKASIDVDSLRMLSNIHLLGPRDHRELPHYSQHWTASILPFRDTPQIRACNPLKLREYLAAGRPVISTPYPAASAYRDVVDITDDSARFCDRLEQARRLAGPQIDLQQRVRHETWDARAAQVNAWLNAL